MAPGGELRRSRRRTGPREHIYDYFCPHRHPIADQGRRLQRRSGRRAVLPGELARLPRLAEASGCGGLSVVMAATITAEQRDALYDRVLDRLSGIGDILLAANSKDFATADRLGREYSDELTLVCDGLGWGGNSESEVIELKTPPELLRRVFGRLRDATASEREAQARSWDESRTLEERNRLVDQACTSVLQTLERAS
jgi:hypothetical protein